MQFGMGFDMCTCQQLLFSLENSYTLIIGCMVQGLFAMLHTLLDEMFPNLLAKVYECIVGYKLHCNWQHAEGHTK